MNSQKWRAAQPSPKTHMHSSSMNDAINPPSSSDNPRNIGAVLRNSTFKLSNVGGAVHKTPSIDTAEQSATTKYSTTNSFKYNHASMQNSGSNKQVPSSSSKKVEKEVDYYHNPTELFRWINYRRWDGARARVHSNPEESSVWVVSRHSNDGRILWRQLPLHLVSMQCGVMVGEQHNFHNDENRDDDENLLGHAPPGIERGASPSEEVVMHNSNLTQVEQLVEDLLEAHPEAASLQDDQGMLPIHTCLNAINPSKNLGPNERVLSLLLLANATAVNVRDNYGRAPVDIVREKMKISQGTNILPYVEATLRLVKRAEAMSRDIKAAMAEEAEKNLKRVEKQANNERLASQRIIRRLEEELAEEQNRAQREVTSAGEMKQTSNILYEELRMVKQDYATLELDLDQARKERDDLVSKNERLRNEMDKQEENVSQIKGESEKKANEQKQMVASLRSEVNTARAMAEGMESQLRSKFSNEEELKSLVSQVRKEMATQATQSKREKKQLMEDIERLEDELKHANTFAEDMKKKNETLEQRNADLDKHLGQVLVAYNSLSSEYDQLFDSTSRHETSMMESIRVERSNVLAALEKQKKMFETSIAEQEQLMAQASKKEGVLRDMFAQAKKREIEAVGKIKEDFQAIRTQLSTKHCIVTEPVSIFNEDNYMHRESTKANNQEGIPTPDNNELDQNNMRILEPTKETSMDSNEIEFSSKSNVNARDHVQGSQQQAPVFPLYSNPEAPAVELKTPNAYPKSSKSPGLLSLLEERAQHSSRRSHTNSASRMDKDAEALPSVSVPFHSSSASKPEHRRPSPDLREDVRTRSSISSLHQLSSSSKRHHQSSGSKSILRSPPMTFMDEYKRTTTPNNTQEVMRQWPVSAYAADGSDSTTVGGYTASQNSFSLDEFSDVDSRISSGISSFGDQRNHQFKGMRNAMKNDLIRVNNARPQGSQERRDPYYSKSSP